MAICISENTPILIGALIRILSLIRGSEIDHQWKMHYLVNLEYYVGISIFNLTEIHFDSLTNIHIIITL